MKKILIVNNNMKVGGVQKSLYNLLWSLDTKEQYEITLLLFSKVGPYIDTLPDSVKIVECGKMFRYLGISQKECEKNLKDKLIRGVLAAISRIFGRSTALRLMLAGQPMLNGTYDVAISYLHNGRRKSFYGGVQEYVLERVQAKRKIAFLHGDYKNCGADHPENNRVLERFDCIAACSDGCRKVLEDTLPCLKEKCVTVQNCHRFDEIRTMAADNPLKYNEAEVNVVMVSRLTHEKGIERALYAVSAAVAGGSRLKLHVIGSGPMESELQCLVNTLGIRENVLFYGEQTNPYRYMKNADLLLMTSYHEAAPMVIDEARALGLPVLTTRTTSSTDMVTCRNGGWVCENTQEALNEAVEKYAGDQEMLIAYKKELLRETPNNETALNQFRAVLEGEHIS